MRLLFLFVAASCAIANAQKLSEVPSEVDPDLIGSGESLEASPAIDSVFQNTGFDSSDVDDDAIAPTDTPNAELSALNSGTPDDSDPIAIQTQPITDSIVSSNLGSELNSLHAYCPPLNPLPKKLREKRQTCPLPPKMFMQQNGIGSSGNDILENEEISEEDSDWDRKRSAENPRYYEDNEKAKRLCYVIAGTWRPYPLCCLGPKYKFGMIWLQLNCETYVLNRPRCLIQKNLFCCQLLDKYYKWRWGFLGWDCVDMFPHR